ncbi:MAG: FKBP-type peptidyl-prolyl cis-trans isomerase [Prevotellaceae bacterium]|jgi:hypothetical protein|nr:FKBP-type peptidyl-prolyl cis-trans isomerase [Prevotellaceae bacterium]
MLKTCRILLFASLCFALFATACNNAGETDSAILHIGRDRLININKYMVDKDFDVIRHFIKRKSWRMIFADKGYFYEIFDRGNNPEIKSGMSILYNYTVSLLDGTQCYTENNKTFTVDAGEEISGLHDAVKLLGKGGKARFIFLPHLAYGLQGDFNKIPSRAILVYNVHITAINKEK